MDSNFKRVAFRHERKQQQVTWTKIKDDKPSIKIKTK